ncbi:hypothetical protein L2E82_44811 [Cichorium intybus]|uniref:Uncharacterized protein n=1 Tax=Cichorium intybus TaxID=13427 RepID=A0ACB8ZRA1_CICIN|nr:hypothetical protein L2E82_44811 [Cichorium intybus]
MNEGDDDIAREALKRRKSTASKPKNLLTNLPLNPTAFSSNPSTIHQLEERFYFSDNVLPYFETGIPLSKQRLHQLPHADNVVIAFPDDGAWKRFHKQLDHFAMVR